ncbi:hypothetical protein BDB01DRAFT_375622 [Pilobolus umbonatus]|nr:hypothetical protein BDB01DRAFT_375622 [Pilobolus umbonatus]
MYILGGSEILKTNTSDRAGTTYKSISQVTFPDYQWRTHNCTNEPLYRVDHSVTLLPDGVTLLMYGGATSRNGSREVITDVMQLCYLLDLKSYVWRSCNLDITTDLNPFRYYHSAVLVEDHLFILYGRLSRNTSFSSILVFDVSDASNIRYVPEYTYLQHKQKEGLSNGAIVGIIIVCVVLVMYIYYTLLFHSIDILLDFWDWWSHIFYTQKEVGCKSRRQS